jgi:hypothetical protein
MAKFGIEQNLVTPLDNKRKHVIFLATSSTSNAEILDWTYRS